MNQSAIEQISETAGRYRLRIHKSKTPEQRIDAFIALQKHAMKMLKSNPDAFAAFHRRSRHQRRESNVRRLERIMKRQADSVDNE